MPTVEQYADSLGSPKPIRRSGWRKLLKTVLLSVLLMILTGVGYGVYLGLQLAKVSDRPWSLEGLATDNQGRTNILILGVGDPGHSGEKLSDTMMVLSLDAQRKRVAQISLPRDLRVAIPGYGERKINTANALGGSALAIQTVSETLDLPIHYYLQTNFSGFKGLVDAVGGIDVDVKSRLRDIEYPCEDNQYKACGLDIQSGLQHMDGTKVLQYARCRKGTCGDDFGRAARQQEVMVLVREKLLRPEVLLHPLQLKASVAAVRSSVVTDMSAFQLFNLAQQWEQARDNQPVQLVLSTARDGYLRSSGGDLVPVGGSFEAIRERVKQLFN